MAGVDLDVTLYAHPRDRERTITRLERTVSPIDAEGMERAENLSVDSLRIDDRETALEDGRGIGVAGRATTSSARSVSLAPSRGAAGG
jgi:hypothetical protein